MNMYGKIFESMYDGTLASKGPWQALVTFQQLIVLCDRYGVVDMTADAISRRTTVPVEIIKKGLEELEKPDDESRIDDLDGRRIVRLADHRNWGWRIVNHGHYRQMRDEESRKEYMRKYMAARRLEKKGINNGVNNVSSVSHSKPMQYAHADTHTKIKPTVGQTSETDKVRKQVAKDILEFLNDQTGRKFRPVDVNLNFITARLKQGYTPAQCRAVIVRKKREALESDDFNVKWLRPATLFNNEKFNQYVADVPDQEESHDPMP